MVRWPCFGSVSSSEVLRASPSFLFCVLCGLRVLFAFVLLIHICIALCCALWDSAPLQGLTRTPWILFVCTFFPCFGSVFLRARRSPSSVVTVHVSRRLRLLPLSVSGFVCSDPIFSLPDVPDFIPVVLFSIFPAVVFGFRVLLHPARWGFLVSAGVVLFVHRVDMLAWFFSALLWSELLILFLVAAS